MLYLGYHLSSVNGFEAMGREAIRAGANTFAFRRTRRRCAHFLKRTASASWSPMRLTR